MVMKIRVKIVSVKNKCVYGFKVGDEVVIDERGVHGDICIHALYSLLPKAFALMYGAEFPWLKDKDVARHACPDPVDPVVFELTREK